MRSATLAAIYMIESRERAGGWAEWDDLTYAAEVKDAADLVAERERSLRGESSLGVELLRALARKGVRVIHLDGHPTRFVRHTSAGQSLWSFLGGAPPAWVDRAASVETMREVVLRVLERLAPRRRLLVGVGVRERLQEIATGVLIELDGDREAALAALDALRAHIVSARLPGE